MRSGQEESEGGKNAWQAERTHRPFLHPVSFPRVARTVPGRLAVSSPDRRDARERASETGDEPGVVSRGVADLELLTLQSTGLRGVWEVLNLEENESLRAFVFSDTDPKERVFCGTLVFFHLIFY